MDRRSFLLSIGSASLAATNRPTQEHSTSTETLMPAECWDEIDRQTKLLRLAERVVPGTELGQLTATPADFNGAASDYNQSRSDPSGTPVMNWLAQSDISVTPSDIAIAAYTITDDDNVGALLPHYIDSAAIALPPGEVDAVVSAVKGWEDHAREQATHTTSTRTVSGHRGLTRRLTFTNPDGYRVQRLCILGDRMLVHWTEGVYANNEPRFSGMVASKVEEEILLRRARAYLEAGHSIPDEPIFPKQSRWQG